MVETSSEQSDVNVVTVFDIGKDEVLGFAGGQWVEIVDAESTLKGTPYPLVQIDKVDPATRKITMKTSVAAFKNTPYLKLRRWDPTDNMAKTDGIEMTAGWLDLEGGIQVQFAQGSYRSGDYWLIPARTATGEIEWPPFEVPNTHPIPQPPIGIRHHYCRLALLKVQGGDLHRKIAVRSSHPSLKSVPKTSASTTAHASCRRQRPYRRLWTASAPNATCATTTNTSTAGVSSVACRSCADLIPGASNVGT